MDVKKITNQLDWGLIVKVSAKDWASVESAFEEVERHSTFVAGDLVIARINDIFVAVEQPSEDERVIRPLEDEKAVKEFVKSRLDTYERMWDGCGVKIDYYS